MSAADPSAAYRVDGPARATADPLRTLHLARVLALTDWKVRFFGSVLGYLWSLLRPLLLFGILYVVFAVIVDVGEGVEAYPIQLLAAMVLFFFFSELTNGALTSLVDREALVRKMGFPRIVVPTSVGLTAVMNLALNAMVLVIFVAALAIEPRWSWLLLPLPVAILAVGAFGMGLLLSALFVRFRDIRPIWEVTLQALFYATPILYPVERLLEASQTLATLAMMNPLAVLIQQTRHLLLGPDVPAPGDVVGADVLLAVPAVILVVVVGAGLLAFTRAAPRAAEHL